MNQQTHLAFAIWPKLPEEVLDIEMGSFSEDASVREEFSGKAWQELTDVAVAHLCDSWPFMPAEAFHAAFPAVIDQCLSRNLDVLDRLQETIQTVHECRNWPDSCSFSTEQMSCVSAALVTCFECRCGFDGDYDEIMSWFRYEP
jgi:hypothetical protein